MNPPPRTSALRAVAKRVVWFKDPDDALADPVHFLAHVMTYGTPEDLVVVRQAASRQAFLDALEAAPPGVFDARSWSYWHLVLAGRLPAPPMPARRFG